MSDEKLSSDAVPAKFAEWLLAMGCPEEKVPSVDKLSEMCRGHYYMVWRSLMEHAAPKDVIKQKRLQVFSDDVRRCKQKDVFTEHSANVVVPEQLLVWKQQVDLEGKVAGAKSRVAMLRKDLDELKDKVSLKMSQRNISRRRVEDSQRRSWLLQEVAQDLQTKKDNLHETRTIADSLCSIEEDGDVQEKLDKYVATLRRPSLQGTSSHAANSSVVSANGDTEFEDQLTSLVKARGDALCTQLYERRAGLVAALAVGGSGNAAVSRHNRVTPQCVLAHTAALHCTLALQAAKNRIHLKRARQRLVDTLNELNDYLTGETCELLVIRGEKAHVEARVKTLRLLLDELTSRSGVFHAGDEVTERSASTRPIAVVDKAIETKRDDLKKVISCLATTERKIQNVRECLDAVFNAFKDETPIDRDRFRGLDLDLPNESITTLRQFYESRRERRQNKVELSMELDVSDGSFGDCLESNNPRFLDELRVYLKKFNLEKNRKLVLDSGDQIWIFETLQSSVHRLHSAWLAKDMASPLLSPPTSLANNLVMLAQAVANRTALEGMLRGLDSARSFKDIEIKSQIDEEHQTIDKIKKRLKDSLHTLQKTRKTLDLGQETLGLWSDNGTRRFISTNRTIDRMTYKDYETYYLDNSVCK